MYIKAEFNMMNVELSRGWDQVVDEKLIKIF